MKLENRSVVEHLLSVHRFPRCRKGKERKKKRKGLGRGSLMSKVSAVQA